MDGGVIGVGGGVIGAGAAIGGIAIGVADTGDHLRAKLPEKQTQRAADFIPPPFSDEGFPDRVLAP